jgi:thioredoxin reductase (NADPH)
MPADVVVVGGGPAGATAATFLARRGHDVVLVDPLGVGGQLINIDRLFDLPAVASPAADPPAGWDLAATLGEEALDAGVALRIASAVAVAPAGATPQATTPATPHGGWSVELDDGTALAARAVLVATGGRPRPLPGDETGALAGRGVSYCAGCDAGLFAGRRVAVVGGGDEALAEAATLAASASEVVVLAPAGTPAPSTDRQREVAGLANVARRDADVMAVGTDDAGRVRDVRLDDGTVLVVDGVFGAHPTVPAGELAPPGVPRLPDGALHTGADGQCATAPGLFAAGEVRHGTARYVTAVVGDATSVAAAMHAYLGGGAR